MKKNSKHLRIASFLEILLGAGSIAAIQGLLGSSGVSVPLPELAAQNAFFGILFLYGADVFKILAGLFGLLLANRKSLFTVILGILLFLAQLVAFIRIGNDMVQIAIHIVLLIIPYYYLHNAVKLYRRPKAS